MSLRTTTVRTAAPTPSAALRAASGLLLVQQQLAGRQLVSQGW